MTATEAADRAVSASAAANGTDDDLPTFVVIGAMKAATTTIHEILRAHPSVFVPELKETNFFIDDGNWNRGVDWYRSLFAPGADAVHRGEASPGYTMFPHYAHAPERMAALVPDVRLVYMTRDPIARMRSSWIQLRYAGTERREIGAALLGDSVYLLPSCYMLQLDQYLAHFRREQLLVLCSEDLERDPGAVIDRLLAFLDLPTGWRPAAGVPRSNPSDGKQVWRTRGVLGRDLVARVPVVGRPVAKRITQASVMKRDLDPREATIDDDLRGRLAAVLRPDVARLAEFLGGDFDGWGLL